MTVATATTEPTTWTWDGADHVSPLRERILAHPIEGPAFWAWWTRLPASWGESVSGVWMAVAAEACGVPLEVLIDCAHEVAEDAINRYVGIRSRSIVHELEGLAFDNIPEPGLPFHDTDGPAPVHSRRFPWGLPDLPEHLVRKRDEANVLIRPRRLGARSRGFWSCWSSRRTWVLQALVRRPPCGSFQKPSG